MMWQYLKQKSTDAKGRKQFHRIQPGEMNISTQCGNAHT